MLRNLELTVSILVLSVFACKPMPMSTNLKNRIKEYEDRGEPLPVTLLAARYNSQRVDAMNKKIDDAREAIDREFFKNRENMNRIIFRPIDKKVPEISAFEKVKEDKLVVLPLAIFVVGFFICARAIYKKIMSGRGDFKRKRVRGGLLRRVFSV